MLQLILKDLQVQRREKTFFIVLFLSLCIAGILPNNLGLASIQLLLGVYLLIVYANAFDFKYNAEIMINSLPLGRKEIVTAKYLSAFSFALIMVAISLPVSFLLSYTEFLGTISMNLTMAIRFFMISFFLLCIYLSFFFPVFFKLGYLKSRWANFFSFFIIFGLIGFSGSVGQQVPQYGNEISKETMLQYLLGTLAGNEHLTVYLGMVLMGLLLLFISWRFSVSIYQKKEF